MTDSPPNLQERFQQPANWQWGRLENARGKKLRYVGSGPADGVKPLAHIIFAEGLSEFAEKSFELARDFNAQACSFWVLDRQGQGLSERSLKDPLKQHADNLNDDAADLIQFAREFVPDDAPVILMGHSTGGLIALLALHDGPGDFQGAVLTSPLLGILDPAFLDGRERLAALVPLPRFIREKTIPNQEGWRPRDSANRRLHTADYSSDPDRSLIHDAWMRANPALRLGGATYGWVRASCRASAKTRRRRWINAIEQKVRVFTADHDRLIDTRVVARTVSRLKNATLRQMAGSRHELLMETDTVRTPILQATIKLANDLSRGPA